MKQILFVAPMPLRFELTQDQSFLKLPMVTAKSFTVPLHIATVAGLTPDDFGIDMFDESIHGFIEHKQDLERYDLVAITGYTAHLPRAREIAEIARKQGCMVAIGGPGISSNMHRYEGDFDVYFLGEAEFIWPRFLRDWTRGEHRPVYRQVGSLDLAASPLPKWDPIVDRMADYHIGGVQTSRGCPFDCEFCDVSYLFGRGTRHKPVDNVLAEVAALEKLGVTRIIFCDDNFIGNRKYVRELLPALISLNNSFAHPLAFATELTIDVAREEKIMELLADANFAEIFIGIESPNKESLKETNKPQNVASDLENDIKKLQGYGMSIRGSFIVGFDHDGTDIFERMFEFVQAASLPVPSIRVLMAPPGTKLWKRMHRQGRLLKTDKQGRYFGNPGTTNIIPKNMTRTQLHTGYMELIDRVYDWAAFAQRAKGFVDNVNREPNVPRQRPNHERIANFLKFVLVDVERETREVMLDILAYTYRKTPFLVPRMIAVMQRQYGYAVRPELRQSILDQVEMEESGEFTLEIEEYAPLIPDGFEDSYRDLFGEVYDRVSNDIADPGRTEETLVEIFKEFLTEQRNGDGLLAVAHQEHLRDLAERTVLAKNEETAARLAAAGAPQRSVAIPLLRRTRFAEVLKAVEREMVAGCCDE